MPCQPHLSSRSCIDNMASSPCTSASCCAERDASSDTRLDSLCSSCVLHANQPHLQAQVTSSTIHQQQQYIYMVAVGCRVPTQASGLQPSWPFICSSTAKLTTNTPLSSPHVFSCICFLRSIASKPAYCQHQAVIRVAYEEGGCCLALPAAHMMPAALSPIGVCQFPHAAVSAIRPTRLESGLLVLHGLQTILLTPQVELQLPLLLFIPCACNASTAEHARHTLTLTTATAEGTSILAFPAIHRVAC
jgi:hypothetical protein